MAFSRLYGIWVNMKGRCSCESRPDFKYYGGRGITVCSEWLKFKNFESWALANGYKEDLTIERNDFNGNYEPSNCCFKTISEQQRNKRNNVIICFNGSTKTLAEWSREFNIPPKTIQSRLELGYTIEEAFTKKNGVSKTSKLYVHEGKEYTLTQLSKKVGISKGCLGLRLKRGMPLLQAIKNKSSIKIKSNDTSSTTDCPGSQ